MTTARNITAILVLVFLSGCAAQEVGGVDGSDGGKADDWGADDSLAAVVIDESGDGQTFEVQGGQDVVVRLPCNPSQGYDWHVLSTSRALGYPVSTDFIASDSDTAGGDGARELVWITSNTMWGTHTVVLDYTGSREDDAPSAQTFTFTLSIGPGEGPECHPVACGLYCEHGFEVDEQGCEICLCREPEVRFECVGVQSGDLFDLTIIDVGDEEGSVEVDDGGAPETYWAHYGSGLSEDGHEWHSFIFGFDERDRGEISDLYEVHITDVSAAFLRGSAAFDGRDEEVVCYDVRALEPGAGSPELECLSLEQGSLIDLDIIDVGDEEGRVTIVDGGAPIHYDAMYDELEEVHGYRQHRFTFGFDEHIAGVIDELYSISVRELNMSFARGQAEHHESSTVICHITPE